MAPHLPTSCHLSARLLASAAAGDPLPADVLHEGLAHLASRCPTCRRTLEAYSPETLVDRLELGHQGAVDRARERFADVAREREKAPERVSRLLELEDLPAALAALAAGPSYQTWGVADFLAEAADATLEDAPSESYFSAVLAAATAERLSSRRYGFGLVATTVSTTAALLARTLVSARGDLASAEAWLQRANEAARTASDPSLAHAEIALSRMTLDLVAGEGDRAVRAFGQVERQVSAGGLPGQRLRGLLLLGRAHRSLGNTHRALGSFRLLARFAKTPARQEHLARWGSLEVVRTLCDLERHDDALAESNRLGAAGHGTGGSRGRGYEAWQRGRALAGRDRPQDAERVLEAAWRELLRAGSPREAAAAALDLADLHLSGRRADAATGLLERIAMVGGAQGWEPQGTAALLRMHRAAAKGRLGREDLTELRRRLLEPSTLRLQARRSVN